MNHNVNESKFYLVLPFEVKLFPYESTSIFQINFYSSFDEVWF